MKTRRKGKVTAVKGRRSVILGSLKKSPARKNQRRNLRSAPKVNNSLANYQSPLGQLCYNSLKNSASTSSANTALKNEDKEDIKGLNIINLTLTPTKLGSPVKIEKFKETKLSSLQQNREIDNMTNNTPQNSMKFNRKKRKVENFINSGGKLSNKKRKLRKSILSRFNESNKSPDNVDSIIVLEDSDNESSPPKQMFKDPFKDNVLTEKVSNSCITKSELISKDVISKASTSSMASNTKTNFTKSMSNSEDIVDLDRGFNESALMEMEDYHNAFNQSINSENLCSDSVIVIDQDDETPEVETKNSIPQPSDDCFVVWSSVPQPCTSSAPATSLLQPLSSSDLALLKQDKILIDTPPDLAKLRFLNNENDKPPKKFTKTPKINPKGTKKLPPKSILEMRKIIKTNTLTKPITKLTGRIEPKVAGKSTATTVRNKAKTSDQLIFLSKDEPKIKKSAKKGKPREIVIDGNNIGMAFTNNKQFSEKGIKLLIDYFTKKGHTIKVFIPQYRRSRNFPLLEKWYTEGIVVFTPSRKLGNKTFIPYDDRYILEYASTCDGIVVSQDQFRDLYTEKPQYKDTIENRLLVPTFVGDYVMFPEDPLGRDGPNLANFLKH